MKKFYYLKGNEKLGPFNLEDLKLADINRDTLVWFQGSKDWTKASDVIELNDLFSNLPPPIPPILTKRFRVIMQFQLLTLLVALISSLIELESVIVSAPVGLILSLFAFYYSVGGSNIQRAITLTPLYIIVLLLLIIGLYSPSDSDAEFLIALVIFVGTILFILFTIDKIIPKAAVKKSKSTPIINNDFEYKVINESNLKSNQKEKSKLQNYFSYNNEYVSGINYFNRILIGSVTSLFFGVGLFLISASVYKRSKSLGLSIRFSTINAIAIPVLFCISFIFTIMVNSKTGNPSELFSMFLIVRILLGVPHMILLFKNGTNRDL
jgi:ABC-type multidrug transport system fused ATPase/permease subunit